MSVMSASEMENYEEFLESASKEKLIELLDEYRQQAVKYKGELFTIHFEDHDFSAKDYDRGLAAFQPGDKIYHQGFRHRPRKFVGTAVDHNKLTREQLVELVGQA
jgi:hypothetical protein